MLQRYRLGAAVIALSIAPSVALAQDEEAEDTIIVTGSPLARTEADTIVGTDVLSGEDLQRRLAGTVGETLRREPGISATAFGAGASRPIIRGQGGDRVRVLDNGIGSIDASSASPDHAVAVEPAMAERIEVVRGTGLLRYGSSGAGGVVNVIDGRLPSEAPERGVAGAFRLGTTSVDEGQEAAGAFTAKLGTFGGIDVVGHIEGTWRDADDYDIPGFAESARFIAAEEEEHEHEEEEEDEDHDEHEHEEEEEIRDTLPNSFSRSDSAAASLSFIGSKGFLSFSAKSSEMDYGIPGGHTHEHGHEDEDHDDEDEDHEDEDHEDEDHDHEHGEEEGGVFIALDQTRYDLNGRLELDGDLFNAIQVFAGYADYRHTEFEGPGEPGTVFTNQGWEARAEILQTEHAGWHGATGVQFRKREFSAIGEEAFVIPTETDQFGIYTFQEWHMGEVLFEAAARYESTEHEASDGSISRSFDGVSVSGGAVYDPTENLSLGVSLFRTERAPTSEELFSDGPHLATGQYELGDPDLDKEVATGLEAIGKLDLGRAQFTLNAFYTDYEGYVYEAATGEEEDELPVFAFTAHDAVFTGFELEGDVTLGSIGVFDITGDLVADYVDASIDVDGNDNLPRIPPFGGTLGLEASSPQWSFRAEAEHAADQDDITDYELPTDGYTVVNLYTDWKPVGPEGVTLSLAVLNASDEEVRLHTSFLKDQVPLPGRNVRVSVRYTF